MDLFLHSYTFRGREFAECCRVAAEAGYDGVELQRVHFNEDYLARELPERIATAREHGTSIRCVDFTAEFMDPDAGIRRASLDRLLRNIRICADHGIRLMNGHTGVLLGGAPEDFGANGSKAATDTHYMQAIDALREAAAEAASHRLTLSLEVHMNTLHDTLASIGRILDAVDSPALACTPDVGNQYATPHAEAATDGLNPVAARIGMIHLKNCRTNDGKPDFSVGLGDGDVDLRAYVGFLKSIGYTGPWCIEHVGQLDPESSARGDIVDVRHWLTETSAPGRA
jgi:sugar phosphate isomerase/epimerase